MNAKTKEAVYLVCVSAFFAVGFAVAWWLIFMFATS